MSIMPTPELPFEYEWINFLSEEERANLLRIAEAAREYQAFHPTADITPDNLPDLITAMTTATPIRVDPASFNTIVAALNPGEATSRVRAVDPTTPVQRLPDEMPMIRQQVRSACTPAVTRAKAKTGGDYTVEVGDVIMPNGGFYVVAVVTRVK